MLYGNCNVFASLPELGTVTSKCVAWLWCKYTHSIVVLTDFLLKEVFVLHMGTTFGMQSFIHSFSYVIKIHFPAVHTEGLLYFAHHVQEIRNLSALFLHIILN